MKLPPLALPAVVSAGLLAGCDLLTGGSGAASIAGTVSCGDGRPVTQGTVGIYRGRPYGNCLVPCVPTNAPLLAQQRLAAGGHFGLSLTLDGDDAPADLWILAAADGQFCGSGYNFVDRPLGPLARGRHLQGLVLVIHPFVT